MRGPSLVLFSSLLAGTTAQAPEARIAAALQQVADHVAAKFNCSIAISYFLPGASGLPGANVSVAAGFTDAGLRLGKPTRAALPEDVYVYGSITKMFTAAAILQLIDAGKLAYADLVTSRVNAFLEAVNGTKLETLLGEGIRKVTIAELLHMTSGIGDYDGTKYTVDQFANFVHDFSPIEILRGYVPPLSPSAKPGTSQHYCSTNYILLGMVLAAQAWAEGGPASWQAYDQKASVLPASLQRDLLLGSTFVDAGRCSAYTPVHGFLQSYVGVQPPIASQDVWNVSCVGGWTAGNFIGPVGDVARFTHELYRPGSQLVSAAAQQQMRNFSAPGTSSGHFYGMGTFDLDWSIGAVDGTGAAYGHVGDTYGYQSQSTFFHGLGPSGSALAVATNVETSSQAQPGEATCLGYHAVKAVLEGTPPPACTFVVPQRFIGKCTCTPAP